MGQISDVDGENVVYEDILVCEYAGIKINEGVGKHRIWSGHLKSNNESVIILKFEDNTEIYYDPVSAYAYSPKDDIVILATEILHVVLGIIAC